MKMYAENAKNMSTKEKKKIIVVDLSVVKTSPAGSCVMSELTGLYDSYEIHLISNEVDEELEKHLIFHEIKTIQTPLILRYISFSIKVYFKVNQLRKKLGKNVIIQSTQGQFPYCSISYPHFCHKAYLQKHWQNNQLKGIKRPLRKLNHLFNAWLESIAFSNARCIVVPSKGLGTDLVDTYPQYESKIRVLQNPIDIAAFQQPPQFDRAQERRALGIIPEDIVISFVALGDFSRKGLVFIMDSLIKPKLRSEPFKILVVGGKPDEIKKYKSLGKKMGIEDKMIFVGFKKDIRPYLWVSDIFSLPSLYEIFPLVAVQAAAARIPLLVSELHGVEEYLVDGQNGWFIERNATSIAKVLKEIIDQRYDLTAMGSAANTSVQKYDHTSFREKWRTIFKDVYEKLHGTI